MQQIKNLLLATIVAFASIAFSPTAKAQQAIGWKELDDFHALSNQTVHPAIAGDFRPVKEKGGALLSAAQKWQHSVAPEGSNSLQYKSGLDSLASQCRFLNAAVKTQKAENEILSPAVKTHRTFNMLMAETAIKP